MHPLLPTIPLRDGFGAVTRLVVVGAGYVGLVAAACFAEMGCEVACVEADAERLARLRLGRSPIFEPGLESLIQNNAAAGRLRFLAEVPSLESVAAVFVAVGTPPLPSGEADLSAIHAVADALAPKLAAGVAVVIKSTVPPGTGDRLQQRLAAVRPELGEVVVSNPEFLREGAAIRDFLSPDRVVVGCDRPEHRALMERLYRPVCGSGAPLLVTGRRTAELIKYATNAFLATKVSFINEMGDLCEALGVDVDDVAQGLGLDGRIGGGFLKVGPGFGGSCFPKDIAALLDVALANRVPLRVIGAACEANVARKAGLAARVAEAIGGPVGGQRVAVLGLAFKPQTDDVRAAPAIRLVEDLCAAGASVSVYDPKAIANARPLLPDASFAADPYACASGADAVVLATQWPELVELDVRRLAAVVRSRVFVDLRAAAPHQALRDAGFHVWSVGRPPLDPPSQPSRLRDVFRAAE